MVLAVQYVVDPSLPDEFYPLYQSMVAENGTWRFPTALAGPSIDGPPPGWDIDFTAPNRYTLAHYLSAPVSIQIVLSKVGYSYKFVEFHPNFITIDTFDAEGNPAPVEWKFLLRQVHLLTTEASA